MGNNPLCFFFIQMAFKNVAQLTYFGMPVRNKNDILRNNQELIKFQKMPVTTKFSFFLFPIINNNFTSSFI